MEAGVKPIVFLLILLSFQTGFALQTSSLGRECPTPYISGQREQSFSDRIVYPLNEEEYYWADSFWALSYAKTYTASETNPLYSILVSSFHQGVMTSQYKEEHYYSNSGYLEYVALSDLPDWLLRDLKQYIYNNLNQLVQIQFYGEPVSFEEPGLMHGRLEYEYDNLGNKTGAYFYSIYPDFEYVAQRNLYYYNDQGQLIREDYAWCNDDFWLEYSSTMLYTYNMDGRLNEIYSFPTGQNTSSPGCGKSVHVYDANGFHIRTDRMQIPYPNGTEFEITGKNLFANDAWGRHLEEVQQSFYNDIWHNTKRYRTEYSPSDNDDPTVPPELDLKCYPNPFATELQIRLDMKESGLFQLDIYNLRGQCVRRLFAGNLSKGQQNLRWDGLDDTGTRCPSGVYLLKSSTQRGSTLNKVVLVK